MSAPYDDLEDLKWHWGGAYAIWRNGGTYWYAQNRQTRTVLKAASADGLRQKIRADYGPRARLATVTTVTPATPSPDPSRNGNGTTRPAG